MFTTLTAAALALAPLASTDTLKPGDPAPALQVESWLKGDAVKSFEKGKVYVVEFWATWCGPCIAQMPHLSELQAHYKDQGFTVIGLTSADTRGNTLEKARQMVADKGDTMAYTVAWDQERKTNEAFMQAAGQTGIPCSFLIDKEGKIAYIGNPLWLDEPLAGVVAGKWDIEKDGATSAAAQKEYYALLSEEDPQAALKASDQYAAKYPAYAARLDSPRFHLNLRAGNYAAAYEIGGRMADALIKKKDAMGLNELAWTIVGPEMSWKERDLDLAMRAAVKSNELSGDKEPAVLDTLARVYFLKGDVKQALELQRRAVELAPEKMKASLQKALEEYEKGLQ